MAAAARLRPFDRIVVVVLDSVACGDAPDASDFGDDGANTLARVVTEAAPRLDNLASLGLDWVEGVPMLRGEEETLEMPLGSWGRMTPASGAKDTMSGHWELMGVIAEEGFPVYPEGFPADLMARFETAIGREILGNVAASGTEILKDLGERHVRDGAPIVYTSADSVFQIAAHEGVVPIDELYEMCEIARVMLTGEHRVARVIARPFVGDDASSFERTAGRRDYALPPPSPTALDLITGAGLRTHAVGKIHDIFAGRGISTWVKTANNDDGVSRTLEALAADAAELIFTNLVDFDSKFGHRRDVLGYADALAAFDARVPELLDALTAGDCLILTADHGNDPGFRGTDHTRERVPLLVYSVDGPARDLGTRQTFADLGHTVLENFGLKIDAPGTSFLAAIGR